MDRQEVVDFILSEVQRLNEEEHIHDLCKHGRYEELSKVECQVSNTINVYLYANELNLKDDEIPDGAYLAIAIWINTIYIHDAIEDKEMFAHKLAEEAGRLGKSIAYKIIERRNALCDIEWEEFFDDSDADKYNAD